MLFLAGHLSLYTLPTSSHSSKSQNIAFCLKYLLCPYAFLPIDKEDIEHISHFLVFIGSSNARDIYNRIEIEKTEENSVLIEAIEEFVKLTESNKISQKTISKEELDIIEKMNDLLDEDSIMPD